MCPFHQSPSCCKPHLPSPPTLPPEPLAATHLFLQLPFYKNCMHGIIWRAVFWIDFFMKRWSLERCPGGCVYLWFVPFLTSHVMGEPQFNHLSIEGHLDCLYFFTIPYKNAMKIKLWMFMWICLHFSRINAQKCNWWLLDNCICSLFLWNYRTFLLSILATPCSA